jgi:ClpX C4-type zinc finger
MERLFQASKRQVPPFSVHSRPSVQNRSTLQLIYQEPPKGPCCSCCSHSQGKVRFLLELRRGVFLCDGCVQLCNDILYDEGVTVDAEAPKPSETPSFRSYSLTIYRCSFCGKEQERVVRLVAMLNNLFICNRCVGICNAGIAQVLSSTMAESTPESEKKGE